MSGRRDVIIFLMRPEALDGPAALEALPPDDRAHVARFRFERDRELALASRTLQRRALSARPRGRPRRLALRPVVACAVTRGLDVGLDVEPWRDDAPPELIERCFSPTERAALAALPAPARPRRFVGLWTLKEAYLKARGLGLELPLELISFTLDDGPPRLALDAALGDDAGAWQLALWSPTEAHGAALCVRRGDGPALSLVHRWV